MRYTASSKPLTRAIEKVEEIDKSIIQILFEGYVNSRLKTHQNRGKVTATCMIIELNTRK